jgi:hypothetical protein
MTTAIEAVQVTPTAVGTGYPAPHRRGEPRRGGETGSVSAEMVVFVVPVLMLLTMFIVFCGRAASASIDVHSAAAAGARAAADTTTPTAGIRAATDAVAATTAGTSWTCTPTVDTSGLRLGGQVSVTVDCRVSFADLGLPGLGSRVVSASATEPVDRYRASP